MGRKPIDYSLLHVFGSFVYVMSESQERKKKTNLKSKNCIFLAYGDNAKEYRLWDLTTYKIVSSKNVAFV